MTEHTGGGDAARTMALLWGDAPTGRRGPKPRLDLEAIVATALALADAEGLERVSMRQVADAMGVPTMSLYTYVPRKAELLELMVDRAVADQPLPRPGPDWRADLDGHARSSWELYRRRPWLLGIATSRTVFGPHVIARYDAALGLVASLGLPPHDQVAVVSLVEGYVRGAARTVAEAEAATAGTGRTEADWWEERAPLLDERLATGHYPHLLAVAAAGSFDQDQESVDYTVQQALDEFAFGLDRILDGIAVLVDRGAPA
jgi:AcrR family transcriptional regulator